MRGQAGFAATHGIQNHCLNQWLFFREGQRILSVFVAEAGKAGVLEASIDVGYSRNLVRRRSASIFFRAVRRCELLMIVRERDLAGAPYDFYKQYFE